MLKSVSWCWHLWEEIIGWVAQREQKALNLYSEKHLQISFMLLKTFAFLSCMLSITKKCIKMQNSNVWPPFMMKDICFDSGNVIKGSSFLIDMMYVAGHLSLVAAHEVESLKHLIQLVPYKELDKLPHSCARAFCPKLRKLFPCIFMWKNEFPSTSYLLFSLLLF